MFKVRLIAACAVAVPSLASAADLVTKAPAVVPPVPFTWTGAYVGVNAGVTWGDNSANFADHPATSLRSSGFIGGAQLGYNYQIGSVVFGPESDFTWTGRSTSVTASGTTLGVPFTTMASQSLDYLGTTRFRLGFTPIDRLLVYGTGGIAYGRVSASTNVDNRFVGNNSGLKVGWAAGLGAEYAITPALSAKLEYLYYDLGNTTVTGIPTQVSLNRGSTVLDTNGQLVRVGLNYKYDSLLPWAPTSSPSNYVKAPPLKNFQLEVGTRYWFSSGKTKSNLFNRELGVQASRLTYSDLTAHAAETFARIDHVSGWFLKGYAGLGVVTGGNLKDEDFPPIVMPYSATTSSQRDGSLTYATIDVGYDFLRTPIYQLGPFVGYNYYREKLNADGCTQTATNPACGGAGVPNSIQVISNDAQWNSVRLGLNGQIAVTDRLTLSADAAWLPYTKLDDTDTHWLRINAPGPAAGGNGLTGPIAQNGTAHDGYQLETILSYMVTPSFSVGVGGRYWHMDTTSGTANFTDVGVAAAIPEPIKYTTDRYGGFIQGSFKF
ncbi:MAG TPA: outer membrane beta-barrel protein [Xanthobacteraceae bacterium]|jgi:opacity protein-like surface antigen/outer membrane protease